MIEGVVVVAEDGVVKVRESLAGAFRRFLKGQRKRIEFRENVMGLSHLGTWRGRSRERVVEFELDGVFGEAVVELVKRFGDGRMVDGV